MSGYSHQKKTNKRTRRVMLAFLFWLVPAAVFVLLAHYAFFQNPSTASAADAVTPSPELALSANVTPEPSAGPVSEPAPEPRRPLPVKLVEVEVIVPPPHGGSMV